MAFNGEVARRLRLQFSGAIYHVINRGNYRGGVFATPGAAQAFVDTIDEACPRFGWRLHAYVVIRNHYHLALETPEPNLVEGMHWLQGTFCNRFNSFRGEHGHVFQGRYQSLLVEDPSALARVVNYIHLNPVRANLIPAPQVAEFRWSSLPRFLRFTRSPWLVASSWLAALGLADNSGDWRAYVNALGDENVSNPHHHEEFCCGWAIGTQGWRQAMAKEHACLALQPGLAAEEVRELRRGRWRAALERGLAQCAKTSSDVARDPYRAPWKIELAARLRAEVAAPYAWLSGELSMGKPNSLRTLVMRHRARAKSSIERQADASPLQQVTA